MTINSSRVQSPVVAAIVLAAGHGTRAGAPKALCDLNGCPAVAAMADRLRRAGCDPVIAVVNREVERSAGALLLGRGVRPVLNEHVELGPLHSLHLGMDNLPETAEAVLVLPVDFFYVGEAVLCKLIAAAGTDRIVLPVHRGRRGHPPVIGRVFLPELRRLPLGEGLRGLYRRVADDKLTHLEVADEGVLRNINTPSGLNEDGE